MPKCILWITASVLLMTTDYLCLQRDAFGMQEANTTARIGIPDSDWTSLTLQKPIEPAEETAPGPLKTDRAASHLPVNQPWRKSPLHRQCPELKLSKQISHTASNHFREALPQEHEPKTPKRFTFIGYRWSIGSPGVNDYFLPLPVNQAFFQAANHILHGQPPCTNQVVNNATNNQQGDRNTHQKRQENFQEIPQTLSPQVTPKLIQIQEIRKFERESEINQAPITSRRAPIVLRAIPQKGVFRQTSSTARLKINLPRHQERLSESGDSRPAENRNSPTETSPSNIGFQKDRTHQRQQDTKQPEKTI